MSRSGASNPQAMVTRSLKIEYSGHPELGRNVEPDTWLTPRYILDQLGSFDLDPCAAEENPAWVTKRFYTRTHDGLNQPWRGRVFMNPPFSNTVPWLERHANHGVGISLVSASVESNVWREHVWPSADAVFLVHGRTRFCNPDGSATRGRPLRSIALIGWSTYDAFVLQGCSLAGVLLEKWESR